MFYALDNSAFWKFTLIFRLNASVTIFTDVGLFNGSRLCHFFSTFTYCGLGFIRMMWNITEMVNCNHMHLQTIKILKKTRLVAQRGLYSLRRCFFPFFFILNSWSHDLILKWTSPPSTLTLIILKSLFTHLWTSPHTQQKHNHPLLHPISTR